MTGALVRPFDTAGIETAADGTRRYADLPDTITDLLRRAVDAAPDREALVETGVDRRLSYRQLWRAAVEVSGGLRDAGVRPGDRVAIRLPNGIDWALALYGTLLAGAVAVPVNTRFTDEEAGYVIADSGSRHVFTPECPLPSGDPVEPVRRVGADPAALFYTSGTTGFPKGAVITHDNLLSNLESCRRVMRLGPVGSPFRTLIAVPLFHATGCNSQLLLAAYQQGAAVVMPAFRPDLFLRAVQDERVDVSIAVPAMYWLAMKHDTFARTDVSSVRLAAYGGAPIAPEMVGRIAAAFPAARVGNGFGLTEATSLATYLPHEWRQYADSVGFPAPVCDVRVDDPGPDGVGELLVRGPSVVSGYWHKPAETAAAFRGGWLHTGDLASIAPDGLVRIVDRIKDVIIRGGENVYCVEVENALAGAPGVAESAVVGVPDEVMGEKVGVVLVAAPGARVDVPEVLAGLRGRIADYKVPQYVSVRADPLPRNAGGKVLKARLRTETSW
ncbi:class I adenylate-forming enzyme family protein [Micromonospora sp. NPDC093277]|uniref:class I adenylate-forming enzyme family protein n=1 Tax=Micromonospora sp. NPDC093277 TaxID=3364291 RepID=UPI003830E281